MANITGTNLPDVLYGTVDNDVILGLQSDDILYGFDGNDLLAGGSGDDSLNGGSGSDVMDGGAGEDFFYGGSGLDIVSYATAGAGVSINLLDTTESTGDARGDVYFSVERFQLSTLNDTLLGSLRADIVAGADGDDDLDGNAGNDALFGDLGDDSLYGGADSDSLQGGIGNDVLAGGTGADLLDGGDGALDRVAYLGAGGLGVTANFATGSFSGEGAGDTLTGFEGVLGSAFDDTMTLGAGILWADAGLGRDILEGSALSDTIWGGDGADTINGHAGNDWLAAGDATGVASNTIPDMLNGNEGDDTLLGGAGGASLTGDTGNDLLQGEGGDDTLSGGQGADTIDGGDGIDKVNFIQRAVLDFSGGGQSSSETRGDSYIGIEVIAFFTPNSIYYGGELSLTIFGSTQDIAYAGAGAEHFIHIATVDYSNVTAGVDFVCQDGQLIGSLAAFGDIIEQVTTLRLTQQADSVTLDSTFSTTLQEVLFLRGADSLILTDTFDASYNMGRGSDTVTGSTEDATIDLGDGNDLADMTSSASAQLNADILGGAGADTIHLFYYQADTLGNGLVDGGTGNDTIDGTATSGHFMGGEGVDELDMIFGITSFHEITLEGGAGNDAMFLRATDTIFDDHRLAYLDGGRGDDFVHGTEYIDTKVHDTFEFNGSWGDDLIDGFDPGQDKLRFDAGSVGVFDLSDLHITGTIGSVVITHGHQSVTIAGISFAQFLTSDIIFA